MTNHLELKACQIPFFINERIDEQETMLEIHEHIAHGAGKARRFVCEFDSSDRKLAEITLAALNARPSPIIPEDAVTREAAGLLMGAELTTKDAVEILEQILLEYKVDPVLKGHGYAALLCLKKSSTSLEPVSDDALITAIIKKLSDKIKFLHHQDTADDAVSEDGEYIAISTNDARAIITHAIKGQSK